MVRQAGCQKIIMMGCLACSGFQHGCLARTLEKKRKRTRAAQQRKHRRAAQLKEDPRCSCDVLRWPDDAGTPGCREGFPRPNSAQERSGRTDRRLAQPHGAHVPKSALPVALQGGGSPGEVADSLI